MVSKKKVQKIVKNAPEKTSKKASGKTSGVKARAKTSAPKTSVEVIIKSKLLGRAPTERHFYLSDGRVIGSVLELAESLRDMREDVFKHHVNEARNDFADWVHNVFEEPDFASELRKINSKVDTEIVCLHKLIHELRSVKDRSR